MNEVQLVEQILSEDFQSGFAPSLYETLYPAFIGFPASALDPRWQKNLQNSLQVLSRHQSPDGSWGSDERLNYVPDRIMLTLLIAGALKRYGMLSESQALGARRYLKYNVPHYLAQRSEKMLIAFEALTVTHLLGGSELGLQVDFAFDLELLMHYRDNHINRKLQLLYSRPATIHSVLDGIGKNGSIEWPRIAAFQEIDGSMGIYPSSTVALLQHLPSDSPAYQKGIAYLNAALSEDGQFLPFYPSDEFERWWAILPLVRSPLYDNMKEYMPYMLLDDLPKGGLAVTPSFSLPDVDTTAMKAAALLSLGVDVDLSCLDVFYSDQVYRCYELEERTSPSANLHALMAIAAWSECYQAPIPAAYATNFMHALDYVLKLLEASDHFEDKWHLSDLYTTSHAVELFVMLLEIPEIPRRTEIEQGLHKMLYYIEGCYYRDGGFGTQGISTVEETGYAARALCVASHHGIEIDRHCLGTAAQFLSRHKASDDPPLWLGKALYQSLPITEAQQISALSWIDYVLNTESALAPTG